MARNVISYLFIYPCVLVQTIQCSYFTNSLKPLALLFLCFVILGFFIISPVLFAYIITMRCLCVTVCRVSIDASCAHTPHMLTFHVLSCCCRCFLTVCLSLIFSFCSVGHQMLQGATMQQLQQVQVQSQGTPITVNTHARMHLLSLTTHAEANALCCVSPVGARCLWARSCSDDSGLYGRPQCEIRWPTLDSVTGRREREVVIPALSPYVSKSLSFVPAWWSPNRPFNI